MLYRLVITCTFLLFYGNLMAIEEPEYIVLEKSGAFELRTYRPMIIAETWVTGSIKEASNKGFRRIAGFIFGDNASQQGEKQKISMTAPVTVEPQSTKISMTAPVTLEEQDGEWRIHFVMPNEYTMQSLPKPNNSQVTLREVPVKNYAVITFSGFTGETKVAEKTKALKKWLVKKKILAQGSPQLARYNPPWTLPFIRRNEILISY